MQEYTVVIEHRVIYTETEEANKFSSVSKKLNQRDEYRDSSNGLVGKMPRKLALTTVEGKANIDTHI